MLSMSKMSCRCGHVISDTLIPCPTEGWLLRDQDQDLYYDGASADFFRALGAGRRAEWLAEFFGPQYPVNGSDESVLNDILCCRKRSLFLSVAECERCGRLWVQREPGINSYLSFAPDEPGYVALLRAGKDHGVEPGDPADPPAGAR